MANGLDTAGLILQSAGAGLAGQGPQFQQQLAQQQLAQQEQLREQTLERQKTVFKDAQAALKFAQDGRFDLVTQLGMERLEMANMFPGVDFSDTQRITQLAASAQQGTPGASESLIGQLQDAVSIGQEIGVLKGPERVKSSEIIGGRIVEKLPGGGFKATRVEGLPDTTDQTEFERTIAELPPEERALAIRIKAGIDPRASNQLTPEEAAAVARAKEQAVQAVRLRMEPQVKKASQSAILAANVASEFAEQQKSNQSAFNVYEQGLGEFEKTFNEAETGPLIGWIPAITSTQKSIEGATTVMGQVLKGVFRSSGEGTFTDQDQKQLLEMLPGRGDTKRTAESKLRMVDIVVRSKLGQPLAQDDTPSAQTAPAPSAPQVMNFDAQGNLIQ